MTRRVRLILASGLLALCSGCKNGDVERLARIWHHVGERACALTGGVRARLARGWSALEARSNSPAILRERVATRLRLDRSLASLPIDVEVCGTTVTLHGKATDATLRKRALDLAEATLGVEKVVDDLGPQE